MSHPRGPGRPKLSDRERKDALLRVRMNDAEKRIVERAARQLEVNVSDFVRKSVVQAAKRSVPMK